MEFFHKWVKVGKKKFLRIFKPFCLINCPNYIHVLKSYFVLDSCVHAYLYRWQL